MRLVTCTKCGVVFDLDAAPRCGGHGGLDSEGRMTGIRRSDFCFVCPLGHAGHNSDKWQKAKRRPATRKEREDGILFMLPEFEVKIGREK